MSATEILIVKTNDSKVIIVTTRIIIIKKKKIYNHCKVSSASRGIAKYQTLIQAFQYKNLAEKRSSINLFIRIKRHT